jgi:hypothetical protein
VGSELLGLERKVEFLSCEAPDKNPAADLRRFAEPKALETVEGVVLQPYYQVFSQRNGFIPSLSIVDLLFNMGPEGLLVLRDTICADKK